jgi:putative ABC transport system permease protein
VTPADTISSAAGALRQHKLRSGLAALGIIIGTSATIAMMAVGAGAREQVMAQIRSLGSNLLIVVSGNVTQGGVKLGAGATPTLTAEDAAAIAREVSSVQVTSSIIKGSIQVVSDNANWATSVFTVDAGYLEARDWDLESGRSFEPEEAMRGTQVALLGQTVSRQLFQDEDPIGREVRIRNVPFRVIGRLVKKGQSGFGQDQDDAILVPLEAGRRVLGHNQVKSRSVGGIFVKVREGVNMDGVQQDVQALLRQRHRLEPLQDDDFTIKNLSEATSAKEASARTLSILLASVALVSLATGGIGILNIMLVSVSERTREIGIRLAVGATRADILWQFLLEAVGLSVVGGLVGIVMGCVVSLMISHLANWSLIVDPLSISLAIASSVLVGVFFGWYPALRASRLEPIEAIRSV